MSPPTAFSVRGKTAIVTGAGSGINYSFTALLLSRGCNVLLADLCLRPEAQQLLSTYSTGSPRAVFQQTDVRNWAQLSAMFTTAAKEFGDIDIVVPGAGVYDPSWSNFWHPPGSAMSQDDEEGNSYATLDINAVHPMRTTQLAISRFLRQTQQRGAPPPTDRRGTQSQRNPKRVLIVSSIAAQTATLHTPLYVAAKHSLNGFVRSLAPLESRYNIRINAIAPGVIKTPLWTEHPEKLLFFDEEKDEWASPEEVADAMLRCLEDDDLVGGTVLEVGKGQTRRVGQFMDPGPRGRGHTVGKAEGAYGEVYKVLEAEGWGRVKGKL
ncbi:short chain dehydrogenase [Stagonosporopsis vannaccii]|nr:short chain dehydrogenase [Stagonosporopsis vannaccii]